MQGRFRQKGFSLIETVAVIGVGAIILLIIFNLLSIYIDAYAIFRGASRINTSATTAIERINREVKTASTVNTGQSTLGAHPGVLVLNSTDASSTAMTVEFYIDGRVLMMKRDSTVVGALTRDDVTIDSLIFSRVTNTTSELVRVEMDLNTAVGATTRDETFITSSVLRGNY